MSEAVTTTDETMGPLNLADADLSGFEPIPSGTELKMEVFEIKKTKIEKDDGKLPQDTPGYVVQIKVLNEGEESQYYNRRIFDRFYLPGAGYDQDKAKKMRGRFVSFLLGVGYPQDEVMGGAFKFDEDDAQGREFIGRVGVNPAKGDYEASNKIVAYKTLAEGAVPSSELL